FSPSCEYRCAAPAGCAWISEPANKAHRSDKSANFDSIVFSSEKPRERILGAQAGMPALPGCAPGASSMRLRELKNYLLAKLLDPRCSGAGYTPKDTFTSDRINGWIRYIAIWGAPLGVVEGIERLEAELEAHFLRNGEVLEQSRVPVVNARSPQNAAARSAQESLFRLL